MCLTYFDSINGVLHKLTEFFFPRLPRTRPHLQDHLCAGHPLHHNLGVAGGSLAENLGADGRQIQQDRLQGVSVEKKLAGVEDTRHG